MSYFYLCGYPLESNSVIKPGNWGRKCRIESLNPIRTGLFAELVYELIRREEYASRPSRFTCSFVCPNEASVLKFQQTTKRFYDIPYEVRLENPKSNRFKTAWSLYKSELPNISKLEEAARLYWDPAVTSEDEQEILVDSDLRIIRRID